MTLSQRPGLLLAPVFLVLAFSIPALASAPTQGRLRVIRRSHVPDWLLEYDDESSAPLTFDVLTRALRQSTEGTELDGLRVSSSPHYAGDRRLLATVSPNGDRLRDKAVVQFRLEEPATVAMKVMTGSMHSKTIWQTKARLHAGNDRLVWEPAPQTLPRTYLLRLTATADGVRRVYGSSDYRLANLEPAPVVRVQGVDAGFGKRSYLPGSSARLRIATDARASRSSSSRPAPRPSRRRGTRCRESR